MTSAAQKASLVQFPLNKTGAGEENKSGNRPMYQKKQGKSIITASDGEEVGPGEKVKLWDPVLQTELAHQQRQKGQPVLQAVIRH